MVGHISGRRRWEVVGAGDPGYAGGPVDVEACGHRETGNQYRSADRGDEHVSLQRVSGGRRGDILQGLVARVDLFRLYLLPYYRFIPALEDTWVASVAAIMTRAVISLFPHEPAIKAMLLMVEHRIRTIPVVADTVGGLAVVGVITRRDLAAALKP